MNPVLMTPEGAQALRSELDALKRQDRPRIIKAIAEAREHGDLKENAEYHAAREQQGFVESRIKTIEFKLGNAQIIEIVSLPPSDKVIFGATVTILNIDTDEHLTYKLVGDDEANIKSNKLSFTSPLGAALIGNHQGSEVTVKTPSGFVEYEIIRVQYI